MTTTQQTYRDMILSTVRRAGGRPVDIDEIYEEIANQVRFDDDDMRRVGNPRVNEPQWRRNVRNTLQQLKRNLELVNHSHRSWRLPTPDPQRRLDPEDSWQCVRDCAQAATASQEIFKSTERGQRYRILETTDDQVIIERLDSAATEVLTRGEVEQAVAFLNAAGGRSGRRTLHYTVAKEVALVNLHPALRWDETFEFVEIVDAVPIDTAKSYWALLCNPARYRIDDAINDLAEDTWKISRGDLRSGDCVVIWRAAGGGANRGVVALGTVMTDPTEMAEPVHLRSYWVNPEDA